MPVMCLMSCLSAGILIQKISRLDPADGTHATWEDGRRNRVTPQSAKMFFLTLCAISPHRNQPPTGSQGVCELLPSTPQRARLCPCW